MMFKFIFEQRKEKIEQAKAAQEKKKADYKAGRAFGVSIDILPSLSFSTHLRKHFQKNLNKKLCWQ